LSARLAKEDEVITQAVVRMNAIMMGLVLGFVCGIGLLLATLWLVGKGGLNPGAHLMLLAQYFPGYSVSLMGSLVGFAYAFAAGFVTGAGIGALYNRFTR
jgi:hypothetical protein